MNRERLVAFVRENFDIYFTLVSELLRQLQLPDVLIHRPATLLLVVDGESQLMHINQLWDDDELSEPPSAGDLRPEAAYYLPKDPRNILRFHDSINFEIRCLNRESGEIGIQCGKLVQILLAHELVHVATYSRFTGRTDETARVWIDGGSRVRYVHEALALRVCDKLPENIATPEAREAYMQHVLRRVHAGQGVEFYRRYFELRDVPDRDFWTTLIEPEQPFIRQLLGVPIQ